jgi:hypothetical protein
MIETREGGRQQRRGRETGEHRDHRDAARKGRLGRIGFAASGHFNGVRSDTSHKKYYVN